MTVRWSCKYAKLFIVKICVSKSGVKLNDILSWSLWKASHDTGSCAAVSDLEVNTSSSYPSSQVRIPAQIEAQEAGGKF